jgi:hypothetical protein
MAFKEGEQVTPEDEDTWGVVTAIMEEDFEWVVDDEEITVKASEEEPIHVVALESGGSKLYTEDELDEYDREPEIDEDSIGEQAQEAELAEVYYHMDNPDSFEQLQDAKDEVRILLAAEELEETYDDYPEAAVENARMALDAREETGNPNDCGTRVGWERANQLDNRESLSAETVVRMAQFNRHRKNSDMDDEEGKKDCGWMMWKAWGGDEGVDWAKRKSEQEDLEFNEEEELVNIPGVDDPHVGFDSDPRGWDRSSYLDFWSTVGGTWTSCFARMTLHFSPRMAKRFCAAAKDEILGTTEWRGDF